MKNSTRKRLKLAIHWVLVVYIVFYVVTGLGIIYWREVEPLTLGLLTKARANQIHDNMHYPFLVLLGAHVYVSLILKKKPELPD
jgi:cytochrome b subunit of formate dehydrogenase